MDSSQTILDLIEHEHTRQTDGMELIPSENYVSKNVLTALGSVLTNKYSEGYPGARYYGGQENIDKIESLAIDLCKQVFGVEYANVQPYSGSPANMAVYSALLEPGDTFMGMELAQGGHLTHGHKVSMTSHFFNVVQYGVKGDTPHPTSGHPLPKGEGNTHNSSPSTPSPVGEGWGEGKTKYGYIDYDEVAALAKEHKPKVIVAGATSYPRIFDFKKFRNIADSVGAILFVDMAHFAGLVAGGAHPSPFPYADVAAFTTHKTMRGPRGGAIVTNNEEIAKKINKAVFPGLQGGPHDNNTAAKAICFAEALEPSFKDYAHTVVKNAKILAASLASPTHPISPITPAGQSPLGGANSPIVTGGTDNHLLVMDVTPFGISGTKAQELLDSVGITLNKQLIPHDTRPAKDPSGVRLGSPAMTTRGFGEAEFKQTASWIVQVLQNPEDVALHQKIRTEVKTLCNKFPLPSDR